MPKLPVGAHPVRIKSNPTVTGCFIYGNLETRRAAGLREVMVYFQLHEQGGTRRSSYEIDAIEILERTDE